MSKSGEIIGRSGREKKSRQNMGPEERVVIIEGARSKPGLVFQEGTTRLQKRGPHSLKLSMAVGLHSRVSSSIEDAKLET
jgi:hypothetical protein